MRFPALIRVAVALVAPVFVAPASAHEMSTLDSILMHRKLVIGYRDNSPPFSATDPATKQPKGYMIDLCRRVADAVKADTGRADLAVEFVPVTAENRFAKVKDGSIHLECGVSTMTLERQKDVDFSYMTFITGGALLIPAKSTVRSLADLNGKKVTVVEGTTTEKELAARLHQAGSNASIVRVADAKTALADLARGQVDAYAGDQLVLIGLARASPDPSQFALAPELFSYEPYAFVLPRDNADFRLIVNRVLATLYRTGEIQPIYQSWFGEWGGRPSALLIAMYALNGIPEGAGE